MLSYTRYDADGNVTTIKEDVGCSNGIGWSPDNKIMCRSLLPPLSQA